MSKTPRPVTHSPVNMTEQVKTVTISSGDLKALNATPQTLVSAPASGFALVFDGMSIHKPSGTAYAGVAAGEDMVVNYTDENGAEVARCETTGFLDQTSAETRYVMPHSAASGVSDITPVVDAPLVLHLLAGEITTGDSDLTIRIKYRVVDVV